MTPPPSHSFARRVRRRGAGRGRQRRRERGRRRPHDPPRRFQDAAAEHRWGTASPRRLPPRARALTLSHSRAPPAVPLAPSSVCSQPSTHPSPSPLRPLCPLPCHQSVRSPPAPARPLRSAPPSSPLPPVAPSSSAHRRPTAPSIPANQPLHGADRFALLAGLIGNCSTGWIRSCSCYTVQLTSVLWFPEETRSLHFHTLVFLLSNYLVGFGLALDVKVIKCRFRSNRAQRYIRLQLFPSTFN